MSKIKKIQKKSYFDKYKNKKGTFWQDSNGKSKGSMILGIFVVIVALIFVQEILYWSKDTDSLLGAAAAAGTLFVTVAGTAMLYMFTDNREYIINDKSDVVEEVEEIEEVEETIK